MPKGTGLDQSIKTIKEQLRDVPHRGLGYGLLRYLCQDPVLSKQFKAIPPPPVSFNYLGQLSLGGSDSIISILAPEPMSFQRSPVAQRSHLIEIDASIFDGWLHVDWSYSFHVHTHETIELLAGQFINEIHNLIAHCRSPNTVGYTPSDFPGADLSQAELDAILQITSKPNVVVSKRNLEAIYPLSPMQKGMVFHTLYTPESGIYFEQTYFTIQGHFDVSAIEKAWQQVFNRHQILRTGFVWQGLDRVLQVVHKAVESPFVRLDWRDVAVPEQQADFDRLLSAERQRGFNLSEPPLLRLTVIQAAEDKYHIVLNHHHALLDGWSVSLLFQEVFSLYNAYTRDQDLTLPTTPPFCDYITWLQSRNLKVAEAYWRRELDGIVPLMWGQVLSPSSPPTGPSQPAEEVKRLSIRATAALQAMARRQHLTISTLVQGTWAILLSHYSRREDVLFGVTVSGRHSELPGMMTMVGLFINTLPLRVRILPQSRLLEWLHAIQDKVIEIQQYDYSPLAQIQTWSDVPRGVPLFDTVLVFENYPVQMPANERANQLRIGIARSIEQTNYPLSVAISHGEQFIIRILYDPERFEPAEVNSLLKDLCKVLENIIANPNQNLYELLLRTQFRHDEIPGSCSKMSEDNLSPQFESSLAMQSSMLTSVDKVFTMEKESASHTSPLEEYLVQQWKKLLKTDQVGV
ncbi:MAG: condensation domain-containing protein, partial [Sedimenticola sp.]|nr:condensation domain-containing protein [Sedimenticola sp.]